MALWSDAVVRTAAVILFVPFVVSLISRQGCVMHSCTHPRLLHPLRHAHSEWERLTACSPVCWVAPAEGSRCVPLLACLYWGKAFPGLASASTLLCSLWLVPDAADSPLHPLDNSPSSPALDDAQSLLLALLLLLPLLYKSATGARA